MGSIDASETGYQPNREIAKVGSHTRFLEEPVDLALTDPVVLGTVEQPEPVQRTTRIRTRV